MPHNREPKGRTTEAERLHRRQSDLAQRAALKRVDALQSVNTKHSIFKQIFVILLSGEPINMD